MYAEKGSTFFRFSLITGPKLYDFQRGFWQSESNSFVYVLQKIGRNPKSGYPAILTFLQEHCWISLPIVSHNHSWQLSISFCRDN